MVGIGRIQARSSVKTRIFAICVNKARTRAERERRTIPFSSFAWEGDEGEGLAVEDRFRARGQLGRPCGAWEDPERRAVSLELRDDLRAAPEELPDRQRLVVTLPDVERLDIEEICRLLDVAPGNARVLLHRGRARLRDVLADAVDAVALAV